MTSQTRESLCWTLIEGKLRHSNKPLLAYACAACERYGCVTIGHEKDGIELSFYGSALPSANRLHYKLCLVPTEGEKISISCVFCGHVNAECLTSRKDGGTSFIPVSSQGNQGAVTNGLLCANRLTAIVPYIMANEMKPDAILANKCNEIYQDLIVDRQHMDAARCKAYNLLMSAVRYLTTGEPLHGSRSQGFFI